MEQNPIAKAKVTIVVTNPDGSTDTYESCDLEVAPNFTTKFFEVGSETDEPQRIWLTPQPARQETQYARVNIRTPAHMDVDPSTPLYTITRRGA